MKKIFTKKNKTSTLQLNDEEGKQQESSLHQPDELEDPPYNVQRRANVHCSPSPQYQGTHEQIPQSQQGHEPLHQATHSGPPQHMLPPPHVVDTSTGATAGTIDIAQCKPLPEHAGATYNTLSETMGVTVQQQAPVATSSELPLLNRLLQTQRENGRLQNENERLSKQIDEMNSEHEKLTTALQEKDVVIQRERRAQEQQISHLMERDADLMRKTRELQEMKFALEIEENRSIAALEEKDTEIKVLKTALEEERNKLKAVVEEKDSTLEDLKQKERQAQDRIADLKEKLWHDLEEKEAALGVEMEQEKHALQKKIDDLTKENNDLQKETEVVKQDLQKKDAALNEKEKHLEIVQMMNDVLEIDKGELVQEKEQLLQQKKEDENKLVQEKERLLQEKEKSVTKLQQEKEEEVQEKERLIQEKEELVKKLQQKEEEVKRHQEILKEKETEFNEERHKLKQMDVNQLTTRLKREQNNKDHIQSAFYQMKAKYEQLLKERARVQGTLVDGEIEKYKAANQVLVHKIKQYEVQLSSNKMDYTPAAPAIVDAPINSGKRLGGGCFGAVYEAKVNGATCVAKRLLDILTGARGQPQVSRQQWGVLADKFKAECSLLSKLRHPNVVQFLGVYEPSDDPRDMALVMEKLYMDLENFITKYPHTPLAIKLHILRDISCGLLHIHSHGIVHRDLNAGNVLLTHSLQAKVADLGASRVLLGRNPYGKLTAAPGALSYMPPEAINDEPQYDFKLDVFSFGHLALYLAICEFPQPREISNVTSQMTLFGKVVGMQAKKRMRWLEKMGRNHCLLDLIVQCLEDKPEQRPTMYQVNQEIEEHCCNQIEVQDFSGRKKDIADKELLERIEECKMLQVKLSLYQEQESKGIRKHEVYQRDDRVPPTYPAQQPQYPLTLGQVATADHSVSSHGSDYSVTDAPMLTADEMRQRFGGQRQLQHHDDVDDDVLHHPPYTDYENEAFYNKYSYSSGAYYEYSHPPHASGDESSAANILDRGYQYFAEDVRRRTRPPNTAEVDVDENPSLPYDPNLVCPKCGKRFHNGEIQKLRRHILDTCPYKDE